LATVRGGAGRGSGWAVWQKAQRSRIWQHKPNAGGRTGMAASKASNMRGR